MIIDKRRECEFPIISNKRGYYLVGLRRRHPPEYQIRELVVSIGRSFQPLAYPPVEILAIRRNYTCLIYIRPPYLHRLVPVRGIVDAKDLLP